MFANFLIGLREGLEAALVVGILVAYLVKAGHRSSLPAVRGGIAAAIVLSLGFGALLTFGPRELSFRAQELLGGFLSIAAVGLITWMIFWMARTARFLKKDLEGRLDTAVATGPAAVLTIALLAVGREGLETALFLWTGAQGSGRSGPAPLLGAALGLGIAITLGWAIYRGALRINLRTFFSWTGALLIVVAAGVLSHGVHDLLEGGVLGGPTDLAFDVSAAVPPTSWYGAVLTGVVNLSPATPWLALGVWLAYLGPTRTLFVRARRAPAGRRPASSAVPAAT